MPVPDGVLSKASFTPLSAAWATSRFTAPWCHSKTAQLKNSSQRKPLSPSFSHRNPPKKHRRVPRLAFLWVKNNTEASADISVPDMACLNDRPVAQPKHASSLSPQNLFFLLKKPPLKAIHAEGGGGLWICFCVQLSLCSDTLQFLEFWLFF